VRDRERYGPPRQRGYPVEEGEGTLLGNEIRFRLDIGSRAGKILSRKP
jgi:hypothetical protein